MATNYQVFNFCQMRFEDPPVSYATNAVKKF